MMFYSLSTDSIFVVAGASGGSLFTLVIAISFLMVVVCCCTRRLRRERRYSFDEQTTHYTEQPNSKAEPVYEEITKFTDRYATKEEVEVLGNMAYHSSIKMKHTTNVAYHCSTVMKLGNSNL